MAYPWPSFGPFGFQRNEMPIDGSDIGWVPSSSVARNKNLGSAVDDIQVLAPGSDDRSFENRLSPARFAELNGLRLTTAIFTDWDRPTPGTRLAFLARLTPVRWEARACTDGSTERVIRSRIEFVSQE